MYNKPMAYRVFLVEDEIITREGIRDNVDWNAAGFEFCGEAPDGEIALQRIEEAKPDVMITDIKMPFLDGLQLSKVVREHMPWVKIIILSGHDEFEYAQSAIQLGVTEYLLKPISAQDLNKVLVRLAAKLDEERKELEHLKQMQTSFEDSLRRSREEFILDLAIGALSTSEALEKSQQLGIDVLGKYYLVALVQIELPDQSQTFDYHQYKHVEKIASDFAGSNLDVFLTRKDFEELILFIKGESREQLVEESNFLAKLIVEEIEKQIDCKINIEMGSIQERLGDVHRSFFEAIIKSKSDQGPERYSAENCDRIDLVQIDHGAIENFLRFGTAHDFEKFFIEVIKPIGEIALQSYLVKQYMFMHLMVSASHLIQKFGGTEDEWTMEIAEIENLLMGVSTLEQIKAETKHILFSALAIRDGLVSPERIHLLKEINAYLDEHYADPDLKMSQVAELFNFSPNYFSTMYRQEIGETFSESLVRLRINKAKEMLCSTNLKVAELALRCGFNDPHYFSHVFKKKTGITPSQFKKESQVSIQEE